MQTITTGYCYVCLYNAYIPRFCSLKCLLLWTPYLKDIWILETNAVHWPVFVITNSCWAWNLSLLLRKIHIRTRFCYWYQAEIFRLVLKSWAHYVWNFLDWICISKVLNLLHEYFISSVCLILWLRLTVYLAHWVFSTNLIILFIHNKMCNSK